MKNICCELDFDSGYLHFDDARLNAFEVKDIYRLEEIWGAKNIYHFGEIHRIKEWEVYVRQAVESLFVMLYP